MKTFRLGTRGSLLAKTQSGHVAAAITQSTGHPVELVIISTKGDRVTDRPLAEVGGKGLFTQELEQGLLDGSLDLAVHSMKDMPTDNPKGLVIAAVPQREDPRDVMVGARLADLAQGAVVGTGSVRRAMQLRALRPDLKIRGIRGNVDTRVQKQRDGEYDAVVLAAAGLKRLDRADAITEFFDIDEMTPSVGQGALAIQCRRDHTELLAVLDHVHHEDTAVCVAVERAFLEAVSGGCSAPAACHAVLEGYQLVARGVWGDDDKSAPKRLLLRSDRLHAVALGRELAFRLKGE